MEFYLVVLRGIAQQFDEFKLTRISRVKKTSADALASHTSTLSSAVKRVIPIEGIEKPSIYITPRRHEADQTSSGQGK